MKNYSAIILSAGYSSRMGDFKPLMKIPKKTPLQSCIDLFREGGVKDIIVVTGHNNELIEKELKGNVKHVFNSKYSEGMYSSIKAGVSQLSEATDAFFLLPVDIASIKVNTIHKMIESFEKLEEGIMYPTFCEEKGHPPLISKSYAKEILTNDPKGGLVEILKEYKNHWYFQEVADRGILLDMDTKEDYKILLDHILIGPSPDYQECMEILRLNNVSRDTINHMISVSVLVKKICELLKEKGYNLDINKAYSAALLHDVAKGKKDHGEEGAKIVDSFGYSCISEIISEHMELKTTSGIGEKEVVYLSDKLIKGTEMVTLDKRFEGAYIKYENQTEILENISKRYILAKNLKQKIEDIIGISLEKFR